MLVNQKVPYCRHIVNTSPRPASAGKPLLLHAMCIVLLEPKVLVVLEPKLPGTVHHVQRATNGNLAEVYVRNPIKILPFAFCRPDYLLSKVKFSILGSAVCAR